MAVHIAAVHLISILVDEAEIRDFMPNSVVHHFPIHFSLHYIYRVEIGQGLEAMLHLSKKDDEAWDSQKKKK
jgi:hypothetical protein